MYLTSQAVFWKAEYETDTIVKRFHSFIDQDM